MNRTQTGGQQHDQTFVHRLVAVAAVVALALSPGDGRWDVRPAKPRIEVTLEPEGTAGPEAINNLKRFLKELLRGYRLRCVRLRELCPVSPDGGTGEAIADPLPADLG